MLRRHLVALAVTTAAVLVSAGSALAEQRPFTQPAFAAAQAAGRPILIDIHAPWCPVCRAQEPIIESLAAQPSNQELLVLRVDFDSQKDVVRSFRATSQSTLIAYRGSRETARSVGDTTPAGVARVVNSTQR